ncbi:MAG: tetratricopeptide repeat protein [candidate division Zixibacteria bacterium]|nr:tetratricopeptide repeat protein [candidate division Zixibacteria bacterium]
MLGIERKRAYWILYTAAIAGGLLVAPERPVYGQSAVDAKAAIEARNYTQAESQLRSLLAGKPKDAAEAHYLLGLALKGQGKKAETASEFETAVKANKKHTGALYELGLSQIETKQFDLAAVNFMAGDKLTKGKDARFSYGMGLLKVAEGKVEEAKTFMTGAVAADPNNAVYQRGMGDVYTAMKVWPIAINAYNKALSMEPNSPNAAFTHYQLGKLYFETRQFNQAIEEYKKALSLDPNLNDAYYQQGYIMFLAKQYAGVVEPLQKAIEKGYDNAETNYMLGESLNRTQRPKMAVPYLEKAIQLNPNKTEIYAPLAEGLAASGQLSKANSAVDKAVALNPNDFDLVYLAGWLKTQADIGQYDQGIVHLKKAIEINTASEKPHIQLALVYFDQQKFAAANPHLERAIEINPQDQNSYAYYGRSFIKQQQYTEAVAKVTARLEPVLAKQSDEDRSRLSNVYSSLGQELYNESRNTGDNKELRASVLQSAIQMLRAKLPHDSTSYPTYLYIGLSALVLSDGAQARDAFLKVLDIRKADDPKALLQTRKFLGSSYLMLTDYDNARKVYEELLQTNTQDDDAYFRLGQIGLMRKNFATAIQNGKKAVELKPDNASYHLLLAQAYTNSQQLDAAVREYSETIKLDPNNATARQQLDTVRKALEQMK